MASSWHHLAPILSLLWPAGKAIKGLPREKVVLTVKWGPTIKDGQFGYAVTKEAAAKSIDGTLKRLGVDYIDLWVLRGQGSGEGLEETIKAMRVRLQLKFLRAVCQHIFPKWLYVVIVCAWWSDAYENHACTIGCM